MVGRLGAESFPDFLRVHWNSRRTMTYRLGNMTLLRSEENSRMGNASYADKRRVRMDSTFSLSKRLATEHAEWNPERIAAHQVWMANQAAAIWRIAQLA